jgi:hypothetical protein
MLSTHIDPFYFIFTLNNSGSTVFSQLLANNILDGYLPPHGNNEGQWIPEVTDMMRKDPWNPQTKMDWEFIKSTWRKYLTNASKKIFIESSPPNMIRIKSIQDYFKPKGACLFISNPYLHISSCIHRYSKNETFKNAAQRLSYSWLDKAKFQLENVQNFQNLPLIKYEHFCVHPEQAARKALKQLQKNEKNKIITTNIKGKKNTLMKSITNMTPRHLAFLGDGGIDIINTILSEHPTTLYQLGYELIGHKKATRILNSNLLQACQGITNRLQWEQIHQI